MTSLHEGFALIDVVKESHVEGLFEGHLLARGAELQGLGPAHQTRKALGTAHARHDPEVHLRQAHAAAVLLADADVRGHGDLEAAADGNDR